MIGEKVKMAQTKLNDSLDFPPIPKPLMDKLDEMYPERCPESSQLDREIWIRVGERKVIRKLLAEFKRQNETVLAKS